MEWQPIETAPRDGTMFLMWSRDEGFFVGNWPEGYATGLWHKTGKNWSGSFDSRGLAATHWVNVPKPPKTTE